MRFRDILIYALVGALVLPAQQAAPASSQAVKPADPPPAPLTITAIAGEGQHNSVRNHTAVPPAVEVKDATGKPVVGAEVVFQLPLSGPGAMFNGWLRSQTVRTDANGKATVNGYEPNTEAGNFTIKVTATAGSQAGSLVISQINDNDGPAVLAPAAQAPAPKAAATPAKRSIPWKIVGPVIAAVLVIIVAVGLRAGD